METKKWYCRRPLTQKQRYPQITAVLLVSDKNLIGVAIFLRLVIIDSAVD